MNLPAWTALLDFAQPGFVPTRHRLADVACDNGFVAFEPTGQCIAAIRTLATKQRRHVSFTSARRTIRSQRRDSGGVFANADDVIYFSSYVDLPRIDVAKLLDENAADSLRDATVLLIPTYRLLMPLRFYRPDSFVTISEITAALLADLENDRTISAPPGIKAMEYLIPAMLAIVAVLFCPTETDAISPSLRRLSLRYCCWLKLHSLFGLNIRIDLGRPILVFVGIAISKRLACR